MKTYVITFDSTECAMDAADALSVAGIHFRTLPTPLAISAGCGIALRIDGEDDVPPVAAVRVIAQTECGRALSEAPLFHLYRKEGECYVSAEILSDVSSDDGSLVREKSAPR